MSFVSVFTFDTLRIKPGENYGKSLDIETLNIETWRLCKWNCSGI